MPKKKDNKGFLIVVLILLTMFAFQKGGIFQGALVGYDWCEGGM